MRDNTMHLLRDSWQFSFRMTEKGTRISSEMHYVCRGYALLVYSAFLWLVLKIVYGRVLSFLSSYHYTNLRATKCSVQTRFASSFGNFRPLLYKV